MNSLYRYTLSREIDMSSNRLLLVCMLNPSTADDTKNDPTISQVCRLTKNGGFGKLLVVNLLGIRATKPDDIWLHDDPIGKDNWKAWCEIIKDMDPEQDEIGIAWGRPPQRKRDLVRYLPSIMTASSHLKLWRNPLKTWKVNVDGSPRHPDGVTT